MRNPGYFFRLKKSKEKLGGNTEMDGLVEDVG